jgi:hypothetical protein
MFEALHDTKYWSVAYLACTFSYCLEDPCTVTVFWSFVRPHLRSDHYRFIDRSSLAITSRYLVAKQGRLGEKWPEKFATKYL